MLNWDGSIIQGLDPFYKALHSRDMNDSSIGIEINNVAVVIPERRVRRQDTVFGGFVDYRERTTSVGRCGGGIKESFDYTDEQYSTLVRLLRVFHEVLGVPLIIPENDQGLIRRRLSDPLNYRGFLGHWHCQAGKWDPGPGFDWDRMMEGLHGKSNHWPVLIEGLSPLRDLRNPSAEQVINATEPLFLNTEQERAGGTYPLGMNQEWHDGVHVFAPTGTPVRAIAPGKVVLTRNGPNFPLGSPNFVLLRHDTETERVVIDEATGESEIVPAIITWFSLYMHLEKENPEDVGDTEDAGQEAQNGQRLLPYWFMQLVERARRTRPQLQRRADFSMGDVEADPVRFEERARAMLRPAGRLNAYEAVEQGNPYRWMIDPETGVGEVEVQAGDVIGHVGAFGQLEYAENGEISGNAPQMHEMVQIQVFSSLPIFDDTRYSSENWIRVQGDLSGNSLVSAREVIVPILEATGRSNEENRGQLAQGRLLRPSEIVNFFSGTGDSARFRRMIGYHKSEWDIDNDDALTAGVAVSWPWKTQGEFTKWRAHHIGFKWLTDETRDVIGMTAEQPQIYTYHPIHLLGWWSRYWGRSMHGQTFDELSEEAFDAALVAEQSRERDMEDSHEMDDSHLVTSREEQLEIQFPDFENRQPGEWHRDERFTDQFDRGEDSH
jgi:hypothetical protein